jgi:hypothetical protein
MRILIVERTSRGPRNTSRMVTEVGHAREVLVDGRDGLLPSLASPSLQLEANEKRQLPMGDDKDAPARMTERDRLASSLAKETGISSTCLAPTAIPCSARRGCFLDSGFGRALTVRTFPLLVMAGSGGGADMIPRMQRQDLHLTLKALGLAWTIGGARNPIAPPVERRVFSRLARGRSRRPVEWWATRCRRKDARRPPGPVLAPAFLRRFNAASASIAP